MVTIADYTLRTTNEGKDYFALILQGGIELVKSTTSDMHYATALKCSMPTTFDEATCKGLVGKQLPGVIVKKNCEPFQVLNKNTGEMVVINQRNFYSPDAVSSESGIFEGAAEKAIFA
ncbi:MAG: hypothetical protein WCI31_07930 [Prolixibacteraceae bacterium]